MDYIGWNGLHGFCSASRNRSNAANLALAWTDCAAGLASRAEAAGGVAAAAGAGGVGAVSAITRRTGGSAVQVNLVVSTAPERGVVGAITLFQGVIFGSDLQHLAFSLQPFFQATAPVFSVL